MFLDILNSYYMAGVLKELSPVVSFFKDRYFPTGAGDIFAADKVLVEFQDGESKMAPFMVERSEPIAVGRLGYQIKEVAPSYINRSRVLTIDDLKKRGFGEAILPNSTWAERATAMIADDLTVLKNQIARREEWLAAQTMLNNGYAIDELNSDGTVVNRATMHYYDGITNPAVYNVSVQWNANTPYTKIAGDVAAMVRAIKQRGYPATDLIIGSKVCDVLYNNTDIRDLLSKQSGIIVGSTIERELTQYEGVTVIGILNFNGHRLNIIVNDAQYTADDGTTQNYFPEEGIMVTAPGAGHLMYGQITQIEDDNEYHTFVDKYVPRFFVDKRGNSREIWLQSRPLAAPKYRNPWIYAPNVVA